MRFVVGQRWASEAEPELGLGTIQKIGEGRVLVGFATCGEQRQYAQESAPLRRVVFRAGDRLRTPTGDEFVVAAAQESSGLITYRNAAGAALPETQLSDTLHGGSAEERLQRGHADPHHVFALRVEALEHQHRRRQSPVRGLAGARMDLIPHQLYVAGEITARQAPRVLLADEVGLGKTIEACLILHRLLATGRASRVLIVVPEPLVHQWFVELLRRFNLWFSLFDEERCAAISAADPDGNPFLDDQLVLCGLPLLLDPRRAAQAVEAGWDLLIVDEAHHLGWSADAPSTEYRVIEALSRRSEGLLLLTATPEQLGLASHFARLRLLDPNRFFDLAEFEQESARYGAVARVANKLEGGAKLTRPDLQALHELLGSEPGPIRERLEKSSAGDATARSQLIADLLDRHGTGRVMFRNTRAAMKGFPKRVPCPVPLAAPAHDPGLLSRLAEEFEADLQRRPAARTTKPVAAAVPVGSASETPASATTRRERGPTYDFTRDPRLVWLVEFLRRVSPAKVLLICRSREKVFAIDAALRALLTVPMAQFHEDLELIQRDRNAAWFAEAEGAQILIASEIGSEGRNFQFAQHLVLFDLPLDPELIEQRIGRLDRIGQKNDIRIHVPYVRESAQEVLFEWFHAGLDAFGHNLHAGRELLEEFEAVVRDLAQDFHETHAQRREELETLVARTQAQRIAIERRLEQGRDRLLELNSFRPAPAKELVEAITALDREPQLESFLLRVWDHYGVPIEDLAPRTFKLGGDGVYADSFPALPLEGMLATLDRARALAREDMSFLSWDHPMVTGALDLLLGSQDGTSACVVWPQAPGQGLWLEVVYLLECLAPAKLHADRFLPATPVRVVLDARGADLSAKALPALSRAVLTDLPLHEVLDLGPVRDLLPRLIETSRTHAENRAKPLLAAARETMDRRLGHELERLKALAAVNPSVRPEEIQATETQRGELGRAIAQARLRLDSVRLIMLGEL